MISSHRPSTRLSSLVPQAVPNRRRGVRHHRSRAFTLIEMLVSLTITLIMMGAVVSLFGLISDSVSGSRAVVEMTDRLRAARNRLQYDLGCTTATMNPPLRPESDEGYFLISEGLATDARDASNIPRDMTQPAGLFGDNDDVLAFTVHSRGEPFTGKVSGAIVESQMAEVVYFVAIPPLDAAGNQTATILDATASPPLRLPNLYRRVLLVAPRLVGALGAESSSLAYYNDFDVSARYIPGPTPPATRFPNTLGDLTKHENRFGHLPTGGAALFRLIPGTTGNPMEPLRLVPPTPATNIRIGEDVLLTNILAFDVQVFDPGAPVFVNNGVALEPRDAGYAGQLGTTPAAFGAYADLGYAPTYTPTGTAPTPLFNRNPGGATPNKCGWASGQPRFYDTWSLHYENNGVDDSGDGTTDLGLNGLDDDTAGVGFGLVDDIGEYDTVPPYPSPLRAVRITIRTYEPSSKEIREIVVIQDFLPE